MSTFSALSPTPAPPDTAPLRVSIQGYTGAFHEVAARAYFGDRPLEVVPAHTFDDLVEQIVGGTACDLGLMAIENTLAGSLLTNYTRLQENDLRITGEVYLRIVQNLLVLPGTTLAELREVHSHPVAIMQCRPFFRAHPHIRLVETVDTALSARQLTEDGDRSRGAIAGILAADIYGLEILAAGIETNKQNHTRFLVLERGRYVHQTTASTGNKVSLSITVDHRAGSLHHVLAVLAAYRINLTKIQSMPIIGRPWEYRLFLDFLATGDVGWHQAVEAIRPLTVELRILGVYQEGTKE
ncbi:MAG: prephenate dehydratase [Saprospiraceae bacterium]